MLWQQRGRRGQAGLPALSLSLSPGLAPGRPRRPRDVGPHTLPVPAPTAHSPQGAPSARVKPSPLGLQSGGSVAAEQGLPWRCVSYTRVTAEALTSPEGPRQPGRPRERAAPAGSLQPCEDHRGASSGRRAGDAAGSALPEAQGLLGRSEPFGGEACSSFPCLSHRRVKTSASAAELPPCCCPFFSACFAEHSAVSGSFGLYSVVRGLWVGVGKLRSLSEVGVLKETLPHQFALGLVHILKVHSCKSWSCTPLKWKKR